MADTAEHRLPRTVVPRRYAIELAPDLPGATFDGTVDVTLDVAEEVGQIVLNAAELEIDEATLRLPGSPPQRGVVMLDAAAQRAAIRFDRPVPAGEGHQLRLRFRGILNDQLRGFYRSTFVGADGAARTIATTQFEPADARRAFPCWDEPDFKATFAVTLVVDGALTAISNGAVRAEEPLPDGRRRVRFAETMPMSTYLAAFIVGPFELTPPLDVDGVPLRVAAVPGKADLTGFACEAGRHALHFLASYFGLPYPSDKIDHVAIPDFAFGAMENLGCVTYRESALLVDPSSASQLELQRVATVVAHETAHMWFGDLVTMRWWNGIWLNEAFATFMELTTTDAFRPDWHVWTAFGIGKAAALATDALAATRPVEFAVGPPEEAEGMFDVLTYQKGGAVLRMLEQYLGPETFRRGISRYLSEHHHGNTETTDLWDAIEAESGEPVRATMDSWIFQGGYPLVTAETMGDRSVSLRQERFRYDGRSAGERWAVPVNLRASVGGVVERRRLLLDGESATVTFGGPLDWLVVNDGSWGFYRVRYGPDLLGRLRADLAAICNPLERIALVGDTWAAVVAGAEPLDAWTALVAGLAGEDDPDVWSAVTAPLGLLDLIATEEDRHTLQAWVRQVAGPGLQRLGWDPAPGEATRLATVRSRLVATLGTLGADEAVREEAAARFARYLSDRSALTPDVLTAVANVTAASGGAATWETMLAQFRAATSPQDKVRYLYALGETPDPALLARALDLCLSAEVRTQDAPFLIAGIMGRRPGRRLAWSWVVDNWEAVRTRFPSGMLARLLEGITGLVDRDLAAEVHAFTTAHEIPMAGLRLAQLEERMDINVALGERLRPRLAAALQA